MSILKRNFYSIKTFYDQSRTVLGIQFKIAFMHRSFSILYYVPHIKMLISDPLSMSMGNYFGV